MCWTQCVTVCNCTYRVNFALVLKVLFVFLVHVVLVPAEDQSNETQGKVTPIILNQRQLTVFL